jgi:hypothetical protein
MAPFDPVAALGAAMRECAPHPPDAEHIVLNLDAEIVPRGSLAEAREQGAREERARLREAVNRLRHGVIAWWYDQGGDPVEGTTHTISRGELLALLAEPTEGER